MNDIYQYLIVAKTLVDGVSNNKVANFSYTQTAYTEDMVDGVTEYSYGNDQNIPLVSHTDLEQNVRDKGIRSQAASLPRNAINHFFGRVSYNLNKITDTFNSFIAQITRAFTQNGSFYSALAEYKQYDTCTMLVTEDGGNLLKTFLRTSSVPEVIQGVTPISGGVINTEHWKLMYSTDTVTQVTTDSSTKIASTELVDNKIEAYNSLVNASLATKAPVNHASENTTYGVATTSVYGHIKLANALVNETSTVPTSAILFAVNNALTTALAAKANLASPAFTGVLSAERAQIANTFIDTGAYLGTQDGFLIITDIPSTVNVMTLLEFTMHAYSGGHPAMGVVQCYPYPESSAILQPKYTAIGNAPSYCRIFYSNNKLCFWFPSVDNYTTMYPVLHTNSSLIGSSRYRILSTTAEALPASRNREVTANVLLPWSSINQGSGSGSDADLLDGQHGSYYAAASAVATKANLASPAFTGNPTAPTQAAGNNSTRLATTAFVTAAVASAGIPIFNFDYRENNPSANQSYTLPATGVPIGGIYVFRGQLYDIDDINEWARFLSPSGLWMQLCIGIDRYYDPSGSVNYRAFGAFMDSVANVDTRILGSGRTLIGSTGQVEQTKIVPGGTELARTTYVNSGPDSIEIHWVGIKLG